MIAWLRVRTYHDLIGVDVVRAGLAGLPVQQQHPRVVERQDVLVAVLGLVFRLLPLFPAVQVFALQLLQLLQANKSHG